MEDWSGVDLGEKRCETLMDCSSDTMKLKSSSCLTPLVLSSRGNFSSLANKFHPCLEKITTKGKPLLAGFPDTSAWS